MNFPLFQLMAAIAVILLLQVADSISRVGAAPIFISSIGIAVWASSCRQYHV